MCAQSKQHVVLIRVVHNNVSEMCCVLQCVATSKSKSCWPKVGLDDKVSQQTQVNLLYLPQRFTSPLPANYKDEEHNFPHPKIRIIKPISSGSPASPRRTSALSTAPLIHYRRGFRFTQTILALLGAELWDRYGYSWI